MAQCFTDGSDDGTGERRELHRAGDDHVDGDSSDTDGWITVVEFLRNGTVLA